MDSTNESIDAASGVIDIFSIEHQLTKDKENYDLTDDEIKALRDAYVREAVGKDPTGRIGNELSDWLRKKGGLQPSPTPEDIINTAKSRMQNK